MDISRKLSILKTAHYLQANLESGKLINLELLLLGKQLQNQIQNHWQQSQNITTIHSNEAECKVEHKHEHKPKEIDPRLKFLYTKIFRDNMQHLKTQTKSSTFLPIRTKIVKPYTTSFASDLLNFKCGNFINNTQLVTDHFFHESSGLAELYKLQRERKIWWMRISSDPSRYYLEPYEILDDFEAVPNAQSISIKSRLCFGDLALEHITLVPLTDAKLKQAQDFEIINERTNKKQLPVVIRSVIDLSVATCALIFDGAANKKRNETLFLNRKVAPYQCQVLIESDDESSLDTKAFSTHISNVISRAGLRVFQNDDSKNKKIYDLELQNADRLGIPYTILVTSDSLKTGLLKLRSRDTTLNETIHITDIPNYLLSIFFAN